MAQVDPTATPQTAVTARVRYQGGLRTEAAHERSGNTLLTDAPPDNQGRGEAFSPTDLAASSLVSCMLTIVGIKMEQGHLPQLGLAGSVTKHMAANPRRISRLEIAIDVEGGSALTAEQRELLEHSARNCPVAQSLNPAIEQVVTFQYR